MPELDFMVIADFVRQDGGVLQMVGAGFDTIFAPAVPSTRLVGIGLRLTLTAAETRHEHAIELIFQNPDGARLAQINAKIPPQAAPLAARGGRPIGALMAFNVMLPMPAYGDYSFELLVHGNHAKTIPVTVAAQPGATIPSDNA
jgi:hypothetical protein